MLSQGTASKAEEDPTVVSLAHVAWALDAYRHTKHQESQSIKLGGNIHIHFNIHT